MRKILATSGIFFALFVYGLFLSQYDVRIINAELGAPNYSEFYDYRGATNVHTDLGGGSGTYQDVIADAQIAGLDFLFFTDVNLFNSAPTAEGYHRQLLVMMGGAYSYLDSRILMYDLNSRHQLESLGQTQVLLADLLSQTGPDAAEDLLVLAHPFKPGYTWTGNYPMGLDGIEVINLKSVWQKAWATSKLSFLWSALVYPFNSQLALLRLYSEPKDEFRLWDQLNTQQKTIGFAGNDATAKSGTIGNFYFRFPAYSVSFGLLSNHVLLRSELTGEATSDRRKVLDALNNGQFYMSLDLLGNPKGFAAYIEDGEKVYSMGAKTKFKNGMKLKVHLPQKPNAPFETAFLKDGEHFMSSSSQETTYQIQGPGIYRVVVRVIPTMPLPDGKRWITWIYSNPFFIK